MWALKRGGAVSAPYSSDYYHDCATVCEPYDLSMLLYYVWCSQSTEAGFAPWGPRENFLSAQTAMESL